MIVCFDVDGCLVDKEMLPIEANVSLLKTLSKNHKVFVWSGEGWQHALNVVMNLSIQNDIQGVLNKYNTIIPDIAFDDKEINLGKLNICTK